MKKWYILILYLVVMPLLGVLIGYIFFNLFDVINGPLSGIALEISLIVWGLFGLAAGVYGAFLFLKLDKL